MGMDIARRISMTCRGKRGTREVVCWPDTTTGETGERGDLGKTNSRGSRRGELLKRERDGDSCTS